MKGVLHDFYYGYSFAKQGNSQKLSTPCILYKRIGKKY